MKLATFVIDGQERWGLVVTHPLTGEDWVFDPARTESRLQAYASRPTSAYVATRPVFMPGGWPVDLAGWLALTDQDPLRRLDDRQIDLAFRAAAEATQEAVLNALCEAPPTAARDGRVYPALTDWLNENPLP